MQPVTFRDVSAEQLLAMAVNDSSVTSMQRAR